MPYIASMGIYVAKADVLKDLLSNDMPTVSAERNTLSKLLMIHKLLLYQLTLSKFKMKATVVASVPSNCLYKVY